MTELLIDSAAGLMIPLRLAAEALIRGKKSMKTNNVVLLQRDVPEVNISLLRCWGKIWVCKIDKQQTTSKM